MSRSKWIGFGVGLLMIGGVASMMLWQGMAQNSANVAFAQGPSGTATPSAPSSQPPAGQNVQTDLADAFWNALATNLGIAVNDLKAKAVDAGKQAIEQAVTNGTVTRAQADAMEQRLSTEGVSGPFLGGFRGGPGRGHGGNGEIPGLGLRGGPFGGLNTLEAVATALNMKPADLSAQLQSGKTLADIATAQKVDQAKVKQAIIDASKAQIQREVQDGLITQAQADQMLSNLTPDKIDLTRTRGFGDVHPGPGKPGGTTPPPTSTPSSSS